eukprot:2950924-Prymnesium_polylepis.1
MQVDCGELRVTAGQTYQVELRYFQSNRAPHKAGLIFTHQLPWGIASTEWPMMWKPPSPPLTLPSPPSAPQPAYPSPLAAFPNLHITDGL